MAPQPSRDDVLDAFAMEDRHDRSILERYLKDFPDHALAIVDLSRELSRDVREHDDPLSLVEQAIVDAAWRRHAAAAPNLVQEPFSTLAKAEQRELARQLGVPRQVISAVRDRQVRAASIPRGVVAKFAAAANQSVEAIMNALAMPAPAMASSHKSDAKPAQKEQISFEQLLIEAAVPEARRAELMADDD